MRSVALALALFLVVAAVATEQGDKRTGDTHAEASDRCDDTLSHTVEHKCST